MGAYRTGLWAAVVNDMWNIRWLALMVPCAFLTSIPVACSERSATGLQSVPITSSWQADPDQEGCSGTGGVKVRPCPVTFTKKRDMAEVTVRGPGVTDSAVIETACQKKNICTAGQLSSKPVDWFIYPGGKCGSADIYFYGYNASGATVGIGYLKVINKTCAR